MKHLVESDKIYDLQITNYDFIKSQIINLKS